MTVNKNSQTMKILLVEDNPGDVELTLDAFQEIKTPNQVYAVRDGEEALDFLYARGSHAEMPRPDLILLDLNMPRKTGHEVLAVIKKDESLRGIPVVVLTSSEAERDIVESYRLHANAYIVKPADLSQFLHVVQVIESFWLNVVRLPSPHKRKKEEEICAYSL